ncbi:MAG: nitrilase-related carbon-nitrogen hydrolase [Sulfurospirillum sp.]
MTISSLVSLQFDYATKSFEENFETLGSLIRKTKKNSLVLAPELCLSAYSYDDLNKSAEFSQKVLPKLKEFSKKRILSLTMIQKEGGKFFNNAKIFANGGEIYSRAKTKLFKLGDEQNYFKSGDAEDIKIIDIDGIKVSLLICFELRFIDLWQKLRGSDIILIPSYWGRPRKSQLKALGIALGIANQCFVIISNSSDKDMASASCIIDPFGKCIEDDALKMLSAKFDKNLIKKMRRYMDVGL